MRSQMFRKLKRGNIVQAYSHLYVIRWVRRCEVDCEIGRENLVAIASSGELCSHKHKSTVAVTKDRAAVVYVVVAAK